MRVAAREGARPPSTGSMATPKKQKMARRPLRWRTCSGSGSGFGLGFGFGFGSRLGFGFGIGFGLALALSGRRTRGSAKRPSQRGSGHSLLPLRTEGCAMPGRVDSMRRVAWCLSVLVCSTCEGEIWGDVGRYREMCPCSSARPAEAWG